MTADHFQSWLEHSQRSLDANHHRRRQREPGNENLVLFSTNDYLGLSSHPLVKEAAIDALTNSGMGPRASALISGRSSEHRSLEEELAVFEEVEKCLLFPSGYATNLTILDALGSPDLCIFSDARNHASLVDGCRLAKTKGAELRIYNHLDLLSLEHELQLSQAPRKLIVSDSVFSMDGHLAALPELARIKREYDAWWLLDEAHATLVHGPEGRGLAAELAPDDRPEIRVGTFSKAFGALGGFLYASAEFCDLMFNKARAQVFSTALPVPVVAAARAALRVAAGPDSPRPRLWQLVHKTTAGLGISGSGPILPIVIGAEEETMAKAQALAERGLHVPGVRPPTVPPGSSRLRISLNASHKDADIDLLIAAIQELV